jgi:hypothetical protein
MDWTAVLAVEEAENLRAKLARELLDSNTFASTAERADVFVDRGGRCGATFFNYRRKLGNGAG